MCSCGSGKRYKHCCGREAAAAPEARLEALAAHRAGSLGRAESLYRRALEENPNDVDCLHMLGVVQMERMRYREALELMWDAAERTGWSVTQIRHNLGLVLGKLLTREANAKQADLLAEFIAWEQSRRQSRPDASPLVTVVLRARNHTRDVAQAISSVAAQTYPRLELVIIDDGSDDGTADVIADCVRRLSLPVRFTPREYRGASATLNEGAAYAQGQYVAFLNADEHYAPDRIACLVDEIARAGVSWGFTLVSASRSGDADRSGQADAVDISWQRQRNFLGKYSNSFSLLDHNIAISTGNLFVEREFFRSLGGFRDLRHHQDWDFCLRAIAFAEPIVVHRPLFFCRLDGRDTNSESEQRADEDAHQLLTDFLATALSRGTECTNRLAPQWPGNRLLLLRVALSAARGALVPVPVLRSLAADWRSAQSPAPAHERVIQKAQRGRKTALVVLGMHRSGTSAFSRVLNLCGAFLPAKLKPPKLGVNSKGFWEPEEVLEFNGRVLRQLGAEWNRVEFTLPSSGEFVEEFESDARALLESEYGDQQTILIKDPRMCVLAPLWDRALVAAGYRPVYVVPVRNPIEVAQSLHARGDMTVTEGLALWLAYMKRVAAFTEANPDVVHVRFTELLDDWRGVVGRIANRLDVSLSAGDRADEVDRFLEHSLRRQAAGEQALDDPETTVEEVRALYRTSLSRCDDDARAVPTQFAAANSVLASAGERREALPATVSFVLCIENNSIRDQALLLCESIRRFGGRYSGSPILAFAPRPGLGVDRATRRKLEQMDVEYVDQPLNTTCLEYAPANRVFAGAYAETHAHTDFLVVLDSDAVWLDEPELPIKADVAGGVVDAKGSATGGPGDRFEAYWAKLAEMCGTSLERLPFTRSTIGNEQIRASYNAGLTVARRNKGILTRCADLFSASVNAGLRPYRGAGMNIFASTGHVGQAGSEFWGSSQAALTLAIWATTDRVVHYPDHYNVPLHLVAADSEIDPRWLVHSPVHLHYHWMFAPRHHEVAMELLVKLGLSSDRLEWLKDRTPFRDREEKSRDGEVVAG